MYKEITPPPIYALIVGVSQYQDPALPSIANAAADAQALADLLTTSGVLAPANLRLLLDRAATTRALDDSLIWLAKAAPEDAITLFFFVGHGLQVSGKPTGCYFCLNDTATASIGQTAYGVSDLLRALSYIRTRNTLILLDCTYLTAEQQASLPLSAIGGITDNDYRQLAAAPGRALLAAARSNEPILIIGDGHSLFTVCLLDVLAGRGISVGDRIISVNDVVSYINRQVTSHNPAQHPYTLVNDSDFNLLVNPLYKPDSSAYAITPPTIQDYGGVQGGVHNIGDVTGNVNFYYGNNTNISTGDLTNNAGNTAIGSNINQSFFPTSDAVPFNPPNSVTDPSTNPSSITLNTLMRRYLDEDNFRTLCQIITSTVPYCTDLDYNGLMGNGWQNKILSLYDYCRRRRALASMVDIAHNLRPDLFGNGHSAWQSWATKTDNSPASAT